MVTQKRRIARVKLPRRLKPIPPPKTVVQLAKEQGLLGEKFDYVGLATAVWPTSEGREGS